MVHYYRVFTKNLTKMDNEKKKPHKLIRVLFGIMMVFIYLGMGLLMIFNFFEWSNPAIYYSIGGLLIAYGLYRGYRQIKGLDYR